MATSVTFFANDITTCPVCTAEFNREVLRIGRGRILAGDLEDDLRRRYIPSPKYGLVNPLIYNILVCPNCYYGAMQNDFLKIKKATSTELSRLAARRKKYVAMLFGKQIDFTEPRDLLAGAASYFIALSSYSHFSKDFAPTTKKAICALRASWLVNDLSKENPNGHYDTLYVYFRHLARNLYEESIRSAENGAETFDKAGKLGPDVDTDYGYDGALYMMSLLGHEMKAFINDEERYEKFFYYRTSLAKVFGFGKSSKEKPSSILEVARTLHGKLGLEIERIKQTIPDIESKISSRM